MGVVKAVLGKLFAIFLGITGIFKRAMCFLTRRRKNSGTLLPTVNKYPINSLQDDVTHPFSNNQTEFEDWDNWGNEVNESPNYKRASDVSNVSKNMPNNYHSNNGMYVNGDSDKQVEHNPGAEPEQDFFTDMKPEFIRTRKILIKKREDLDSQSISSRLAVNASSLPQSELGCWEDSSNAWEADVSEDLTLEAQEAIKEKRRQEREVRTAEHQRKKLERDTQRLGRRDHSQT